jgi:hypothetical protein
MVDEKSDSFNITMDERSGSQKVAESKEASENVGKTLSESATHVQEPLIGRGWSIFRVPAHVREVDKGAYSPRIVSIGPFHHNDKHANLHSKKKKNTPLWERWKLKKNGFSVAFKSEWAVMCAYLKMPWKKWRKKPENGIRRSLKV